MTKEGSGEILHQEDCEILSIMAFAYMESGRYEQALPLYQAIENQDPRWRLGASFCLFALGESQKALDALEDSQDFSGQLLSSYHLLKRRFARSLSCVEDA